VSKFRRDFMKKKVLVGLVCITVSLLLFSCVSVSTTDKSEVYDPTVPEDMRCLISVPSYIRITKFNNNDVLWQGPNALTMSSASYAIPPGKHVFTLDYAQPGVKDLIAKQRLMNMKFEVDMQPGQSFYVRGDSQGKVTFDLIASNPPSGENNWWLFWNYDEAKDEWGEKTGKHFMIFKNEIEGTFTKTIGDSQTSASRAMDIRNFSISETELSFGIFERGNSTNVIFVGNPSNFTVSAVLRSSLGERTFTGRLSNLNRVFFGINNQLLEVLSLNEDIIFRLTLAIDNNRANYQFTFKSDQFTSANDRLKSLNTK
jgi:hypothetical protein